MPYASRDARLAYMKAWRNKKRDEGKCTRCGTRSTEDGKSNCQTCISGVRQ